MVLDAKADNISKSTLSEWRKAPDVLSVLTSWRESYSKAFVRVMCQRRPKSDPLWAVEK
jgi:hypothetical protein